MYRVCQMHVIDKKSEKTDAMPSSRQGRPKCPFPACQEEAVATRAQGEQLKPKIWSERDLGWLVGYRNALMLEAQRKKWN